VKGEIAQCPYYVAPGHSSSCSIVFSVPVSDHTLSRSRAPEELTVAQPV
jgi:hypothetical protein